MKMACFAFDGAVITCANDMADANRVTKACERERGGHEKKIFPRRLRIEVSLLPI